jgi:hypothetical protein
MKRRLLRSLAIVCLYSSCCPALAFNVYFTADAPAAAPSAAVAGSAEAILPIDKLGTMPLPRGRFVLHGDRAQITMVPEWRFEPHVVLRGRVLDTQLSAAGGGTLITGTIFFDGGEWLSYYDSGSTLEAVSTQAATANGRIREIQDGNLLFSGLSGETMTIPLAQVTAIRSPRVFKFAITAGALGPAADGEPPAAVGRTVSLSPTGTPFRLRALASRVRREMDDGDVPTRKLILTGIALSAVELAQLAPYIAVPLSSSRLSHQMRMREFRSVTEPLPAGLTLHDLPPP